ncbi:MAG: hypothetical protein JNJ54_21910 [Myxococcaceae bacterium]|nr:hypothetical protein [Myxococcaceae bacterium]
METDPGTGEKQRVRRVLLLFLLCASPGCRTLAQGVNERADAILADYRQRRTSIIGSEEPREQWVTGQFTVHALSDERGTLLERVSVRSISGARVLLSIDRLGGGAQLRLRLTLTNQPVDRAAFSAAVTEAWVRTDEGPDVHHLGTVPPWLLALAWAAIERPRSEGPPRTLVVPAGRFDGCVDGVHPAVPLSGVVERAANGVRRELLEFGDDDGGALY